MKTYCNSKEAEISALEYLEAYHELVAQIIYKWKEGFTSQGAAMIMISIATQVTADLIVS